MALPNVVEVAHRSVLDRPTGAVVSPANSVGCFDWPYLQFFGEELQARVHLIIRLQKFRELLGSGAPV